jgi:glycerate-2-kinase
VRDATHGAVSSGARSDCVAIYQAAIAAVDPARLVAAHLERTGRHLTIALDGKRIRRDPSRLYVLGAGKGVAAMVRAVVACAPSLSGIVVAPRASRPIGRVRVLAGDHPVPGERSFRSTRELLRTMRLRPETDSLLLLLTGGASALLAAPAAGISRADKVQLGRALLAAGAPIATVNTLRKHVSAVKGGGLLRLAAPREVITLALSDVIGDDLATIGSGPGVADPTTFADASASIEALGLGAVLPERVVRRIERGARGGASAASGPGETVKPGDPLLRRSYAAVIGSNRIALDAAAKEARRRGYRVVRVPEPLAGEARECARRLIRGLPRRPEVPTCVLAGGETVVTLGPRAGIGGRSQELALAAGFDLARSAWTLLAAGTDGIDGSTPAAGAFGDGTTIERAGRSRVERALERHDSHRCLASLGDVFTTGPTGTNVMDVAIAVHPGEGR